MITVEIDRTKAKGEVCLGDKNSDVRFGVCIAGDVLVEGLLLQVERGIEESNLVVVVELVPPVCS